MEFSLLSRWKDFVFNFLLHCDQSVYFCFIELTDFLCVFPVISVYNNISWFLRTFCEKIYSLSGIVFATHTHTHVYTYTHTHTHIHKHTPLKIRLYWLCCLVRSFIVSPKVFHLTHLISGIFRFPNMACFFFFSCITCGFVLDRWLLC